MTRVLTSKLYVLISNKMVAGKQTNQWSEWQLHKETVSGWLKYTFILKYNVNKFVSYFILIISFEATYYGVCFLKA